VSLSGSRHAGVRCPVCERTFRYDLHRDALCPPILSNAELATEYDRNHLSRSHFDLEFHFARGWSTEPIGFNHLTKAGAH
jgi:hypothetical protein